MNTEVACRGVIGSNDWGGYRFAGGVIRNDGAPGYWKPIEAGAHKSVNIDSVETSDSVITVTYRGMGADKVVTALVVPDEALAKVGITAGPSVSPVESVITLGAPFEVSAFVYYDGSAWQIIQADYPQANFAVSSFSNGVLKITHNDIGAPHAYSLSITGRGGSYIPMQSGSAVPGINGPSATEINLSFYDFAGVLVTTPDIGMKAYITRQGGHKLVNPKTVDTSRFQACNIWLFFLMKTRA